MPKNTKSSASSATRKKKSQKAAKKGVQDGPSNGSAVPTTQPAQRGQKKVKGKAKEPKKKVYIPPQKPKQDTIDPLDSLGLATLLPSDLVVLLRKAGKKDVVTRSRALEGILEWIQSEEEAEQDKESSLILSIPCWSHLFSRLAISPNRRLRQLTGQINSLLLSKRNYFDELIAQPEHLEAIIGAMMILAFDPDRLVSRIAKSTWELHTGWDTTTTEKLNLHDYLDQLLSHISMIIFHRSDESAPHVATAVLSTSRDAKNRDDTNVEEDNEGTDARLVYGALGALSWLIESQPYPASTEAYEPLVTSSTLWTSLSRQNSANQRSLGSLSPIVRNAAWQLVRTIVVKWKELLERCLFAVGFTALQSAFNENDVGVAAHLREGLVLLLKARPDLWTVKAIDVEEDEEDDEDDEEGDNDEEANSEDDSPTTQTKSTDFPLFQMFSEWLSSALRGAYGNYTIVNLLLSTISSKVYPPTSNLAMSILADLYRPIDERSLEGREVLRSFVPAYLECFSWSCGRIKHLTNLEEAVLLAQDIETFYLDFIGSVDESSSRLGQQDRIVSLGEDRLQAEVALFLRSLGNLDITLVSPLLGLIRSTLSQTVVQSNSNLMDRNVNVLQSVIEGNLKVALTPRLKIAIFELVSDLSLTTANIVASGEEQQEGVRLLTRLLSTLPEAQNSDSLASLQLVSDHLRQGKSAISRIEKANFFVAYIFCHESENTRLQSWTDMLDLMSPDEKVDWVTLSALITAMQGKEYLVKGVAANSRLDEAVKLHYQENVEVICRLLMNPQPYIQSDTVSYLLKAIASKGDLNSMILLDAWLKSDASHPHLLFDQVDLIKVVPGVAQLALLQNEPKAWLVWKQIQTDPRAIKIAIEMLNSQLIALDHPVDVILSATRSISTTTDLMQILPDEATMDQLFSSACSVAQPTSLAVLDPLVSTSMGQELPFLYDQSGFSSYCRCSIAFLEALEETGTKTARSLPHLVSLALAGEDAASLPGAGASHFSSKADHKPWIEKAVNMATTILSSTTSRLDEAWYGELTKSIRSKSPLSDQDEVQAILQLLWNTPNSERILSRLLKGILNFSGASEKEGVHLLRLAQSSQDIAPSLASAIYISVKDLVLESPVYDRIRNELAARLAGLPPSKAAKEGITVLRLLVNVAPPTESFVSLIPQQRCIFLLQTLQKWIASDESEEFPGEIHSLLMRLLYCLLPIVQDMPGSHLPFICDLLDVNLSDGMDDIVCVYHSLNLVDLFNGLAERNATLKEVWNESKIDIFENVHDLFLAPSRMNEGDKIRDVVAESLADVIRVAPDSLFTSEKDVASLVKIINFSNKSTQILAYRLLSNNIRESVKELVVEVALGGQDDDEELAKAPIKQVRISQDILSLLGEQQFLEEGKEYAFLLAWLAVFEHFEESSLQLKAIYTTQIQSLSLVERSLLPFFFNQTDLRFDPSQWALDEVYLDEMETSESAMRVLTAHVFYRSLIHIPNLIRESFNGIKDRQQSLYLRNFIMRHLTPLLSQREFSHLRNKETIERISDENMTIKVLAGSNEVIATYTVDEYPLEISIGMPNDYPLRNVEIKDLKKIGVSEGTWRAWILSIRQLIAGRNGLIFDALMLFKRNVEAKFSGFDEDSTCAVCYSIVSPTDHSLPTKPCKTCKKKFHASCLYKWVSTSGSSTCPLCRSIL